MIKVIVFDLGNVIVSVNHFRFCQKLAGVSEYTPEEIYNMGFDTYLVHDYEEGRITAREFFSEIRRKIQVRLKYSDFCRMWCDIFTENKAVSALIRALKGNYHLFLLSNTNDLHFNFAAKNFPVLGNFEEYILSYLVGCAKPDPRIYLEVIRLADCAPEEIVYIDDVPEYVSAARIFGIRGIHFRSCEQLQAELARYKISWGPE